MCCKNKVLAIFAVKTDKKLGRFHTVFVLIEMTQLTEYNDEYIDQFVPRFGRRGATLLCTIPAYFVGFILIGASTNIFMVIAGRFLTGKATPFLKIKNLVLRMRKLTEFLHFRLVHMCLTKLQLDKILCLA